MPSPRGNPILSTPPSLRPRPARQTPVRTPAPSLPPRRAGTAPRAPLPAPPGDSGWQRGLKAALLVAVAAGSAFGVVTIGNAVENSKRLPLRTVAIVGVDADRAAEIRAYADLEEGTPWLGIDTNDVATRVERHPFVREATIQRRPPDALEITVIMRTPVAVLRLGDGLYLVDDDGAVMKRLRPGDHIDAPLITLAADDDGAANGVTSPRADANGTNDTAGGVAVKAPSLAGLGDALAIVSAAERHGLIDRLSEVVGVPGAGFEVVFDDGARARLGDHDIDMKLRRLLSTERRLKEKGRSFSFIWLDDAQRPERVAVRLRPVTETTPAGG